MMLSERVSFTFPDGRRSARVRLTPEAVIFARISAKKGSGIVALATSLGVDKGTLHNAIAGDTWSHLNHVEAPTKMSGLNRPIEEDVRGTGIVDVDLLPRHAQTILDGHQVVEARRLLKRRPTMSIAGILSELNLDVSPATLAQAIAGKSWAHLNEVEPPVRQTAKERRRLHRDNVRAERLQQQGEKHLRAKRRTLERILSSKRATVSRVPACKAVEIVRAMRECRLDAYAEAFRLKLPVGDVYAVARGSLWPELHALMEVL